MQRLGALRAAASCSRATSRHRPGTYVSWATRCAGSPTTAYRRRRATELVVASEGFVPALAAAEEHGSVPIWVHTHPGTDSSPTPSARDSVVDCELADLFRLRSGSPWYGALILGRSGVGLDFTGHIDSEAGRSAVDRVWIAGARCSLRLNWLHDAAPLDQMFDRSVRAFGGAIQSGARIAARCRCRLRRYGISGDRATRAPRRAASSDLRP